MCFIILVKCGILSFIIYDKGTMYNMHISVFFFEGGKGVWGEVVEKPLLKCLPAYHWTDLGLNY